MTKEEVIHIWKEQCLTVRVVRSKTKFDPTIYEMTVLGHDNDKQNIKQITIMKGDKHYWISVNYILKLIHNKILYNIRTTEYVPCNDTFELTEKEYKELEELIGLKF